MSSLYNFFRKKDTPHSNYAYQLYDANLRTIKFIWRLVILMMGEIQKMTKMNFKTPKLHLTPKLYLLQFHTLPD
jgi:hypothetical protein